MRFFTLISVLATIASATLATAHPGSAQDVIRHTGRSVGKESVINGVKHYISKPFKKSTTAVIYLTDVFGLPLPENRLLVDSFARAGFFTIAPDLFQNKPAPADLNTPGFDVAGFLALHGPNVTDPIIAKTVQYVRKELGYKKVAVTGYCFGGRYSFRFLQKGKGVDVGFAAHPSLLEDGEVKAVTKPVSIAAADHDDLLPLDRLTQLEGILKNTTLPWTVSVYGGTSHGFGVRANVTDPRQKFGKEEAFFQAVRFFQSWA
ncbi:hypothetical protein HK097_007762 [Rhizophlyctis rosea]|uniref:Dienelactone hydrolase domain-containing protein n=1 Tax=Rhizophlyctis rosea TaxID=64517 RepID=A0AAD5X219_9FUNG|nr:hypothetical protein HK097_007762 [Rhizophlyctis rosea]